jgi:hypothetical protein
MEYKKIPSFYDYNNIISDPTFSNYCDRMSISIRDALLNGELNTSIYLINLYYPSSDFEEYFNNILYKKGWCVDITMTETGISYEYCFDISLKPISI